MSAISLSAPVLSILSTSTSTLWVTETITVPCTRILVVPGETPSAQATSSAILSYVLPLPISQSVNASTSVSVVVSSSSSHVSDSTAVVGPVVTSPMSPVLSATGTVPPQSSSSSSDSPSRTMWSAPAQMTDLSAFNISSFTSGEDNLDIVTGIPASASSSSSSSSLSNPNSTSISTSPSTPPTIPSPNPSPIPASLISAASIPPPIPPLPSSPPWTNTTTVLRLHYPAHSLNPGSHTHPPGGAQFYATPLPPLSSAHTCTLRYSVFFPADFAWVLAGKLPGLYGGRRGCSGGDPARDCFSTRLMWREGGVGELYLYAPKDKQTPSLCTDARSVCDAAYGFSIGRGSFRFARGGWTTVQQTVRLNTPGEQDGGFWLDVDGVRVIERGDVYYRGVPEPEGGGEGGGSLLGGLVGGGLEGVLSGGEGEGEQRVVGLSAHDNATINVLPDSGEPEGVPNVRPIGFIGLFFSTFFGGHEAQYATPRDQYVWFKDFAISGDS